MDDDQRLHDLMQHAVATLEPPTPRLVETGLRRGRRHGRWVRGAELATGAAVVGGVAVLAAALFTGGAAERDAATAGTQPIRGTTMVTTTPQALLRTALDTLPRPGRTSAYAGNFMDGYVGTTFVYDDGNGAAAVDVSLTYAPRTPGPKRVTAPSACATGSPGCVVLADGTHVMTRKGHQYTDGRTPNAAEWAVELVRADGVQVSFIEWNAPRPKDAEPTRTAPPFSLDELIRWAVNPGWQVRMAKSRVAAAAHLFTAADLGAKTGVNPTMDAAKCRQAVEAHKLPASACEKTPR